MTGLPKAVRQQKGHRFKTVALIMSAAAFCAILATTERPGLAAAGNVLADPITTGSVAPVQVPHELRIEITRHGTEALDLSARLHASGGLISRPIDWTIRRREISAGLGSNVVFQSKDPVVSPPLEPGEYVVEASYGYHKVQHELTLQHGQRIGITLILNVGGIRAMSSVIDAKLPDGIDARHDIYALTGPLKGRRIVNSAGQGHVLRLAAGAYRVESRLIPGNTVAETKVDVKPGMLASMEMAHEAGLADITVGGDINAAVAWEIRSLKGSWSRNQTSPRAAMVLAPGWYEVKAIVAGSVLTEQFAITVGELRHVLVGVD